jgi:hypothetical protein
MGKGLVDGIPTTKMPDIPHNKQEIPNQTNIYIHGHT